MFGAGGDAPVVKPSPFLPGFLQGKTKLAGVAPGPINKGPLSQEVTKKRSSSVRNAGTVLLDLGKKLRQNQPVKDGWATTLAQDHDSGAGVLSKPAKSGAAMLDIGQKRHKGKEAVGSAALGGEGENSGHSNHKVGKILDLR